MNKGKALVFLGEAFGLLDDHYRSLIADADARGEPETAAEYEAEYKEAQEALKYIEDYLQ